MWNQKNMALGGLALLILILGWAVPREQFWLLITVYGLAFGLYYWLVQQSFSDNSILVFGVLIRLGVLFAIPLLSNDVYRFIWDGRLLVAGEDPFALRPSQWMAMASPPIGINKELHQLIYADNYTVYPPIHQIVFWFSARFSTSIMGAVLLLKSVLFVGEIALLFLLKKAQSIFKSKHHLLAIYALNPLVILEVVGNGHFEGLMVLFLILGILGLHKKQYILGGIGIGLAVATKLLPLMLLPIIWRFLPRKNYLSFFGWLVLVDLVLWFPLWQMGSLHHLMDSIWLYFESFEFNASVFYILKWISPNNWRIGLMTNALSIIFIAWMTWRQRSLDFHQMIRSMTFIWAVYILNSAIVHPWYLIPILALSALNNWKIGILWTGLIFLSYSHYMTTPMKEQPVLIILEYALLLLLTIFYDRDADVLA